MSSRQFNAESQRLGPHLHFARCELALYTAVKPAKRSGGRRRHEVPIPMLVFGQVGRFALRKLNNLIALMNILCQIVKTVKIVTFNQLFIE